MPRLQVQPGRQATAGPNYDYDSDGSSAQDSEEDSVNSEVEEAQAIAFRPLVDSSSSVIAVPTEMDVSLGVSNDGSDVQPAPAGSLGSFTDSLGSAVESAPQQFGARTSNRRYNYKRWHEYHNCWPQTLEELANAAVSTLTPRGAGGRVYFVGGTELCYRARYIRKIHVYVAKHLSSAVIGGDNITKLALVKKALKTVKGMLGSDNVFRAIALHDELMTEAWLCLDPSYAADSLLMALSGVGEVMGARFSNYFIWLQKHLSEAQTGGVRISYFVAKNNQEANVRKRSLVHAAHCKNRHVGSAQVNRTMVEDSAVAKEDGMVLPETRCGLCSYWRYIGLCDCDGQGGPLAPAFRGLRRGSCLSWLDAPGKPRQMPQLEDGTYDGSRSFTQYPVPYGQANSLFHAWGQRINQRRPPGSPQLDVVRFRFYSLRHGAAYNLKFKDVDKVKAAAHLLMGTYVYEHVYGLEEGISAGAKFVPNLVGKGAHGGSDDCADVCGAEAP